MSIQGFVTKLNPRAASVQFGVGGVPEVDWRDYCGAWARLTPFQQDYAELIFRDSTSVHVRQRVLNWLATLVKNECLRIGLMPRQKSLLTMCIAIAQIALHQVEHRKGACTGCKGTGVLQGRAIPSNVCRTCNGAGQGSYSLASRLKIGGLEGCDPSGYAKRWEPLERLLLAELYQAEAVCGAKFGEVG